MLPRCYCSVLQYAAVYCCVLQFVAVCCSVLQCVVVCCSVLQCAAVCCNAWQCVALCCIVLHCVALCAIVFPSNMTVQCMPIERDSTHTVSHAKHTAVCLRCRPAGPHTQETYSRQKKPVQTQQRPVTRSGGALTPLPESMHCDTKESI